MYETLSLKDQLSKAGFAENKRTKKNYIKIPSHDRIPPQSKDDNDKSFADLIKGKLGDISEYENRKYGPVEIKKKSYPQELKRVLFPSLPVSETKKSPPTVLVTTNESADKIGTTKPSTKKTPIHPKPVDSTKAPSERQAAKTTNTAQINAKTGTDTPVSSDDVGPKEEQVQPLKVVDETWIANYLKGIKFHFGPNPKLLRFNKQEKEYKLATSEEEGIPSRFDYDGTSPNEVTMGIDFGTSTVKVVFHDPSVGESGRAGEAVPFLEVRGIEAYLLPTKLWVDSDGRYTLQPGEYTCYSKLKLEFMESPSRERTTRFVAFLALVIRHARSWYFKTHAYSGRIQWNVTLGTPSSIDGNEYFERWKEALMQAWLLAERKGALTEFDLLHREELVSEEQKIQIKDYFCAVSEVQAEAYAFIEDYPRQTSQTYIIVDIGSSTVDIASFEMSHSPTTRKTYFTINHCDVQQYGTTNIHHERLNDFWKESLKLACKSEGSEEPYTKLIRDIESETSTSLYSAFPNSMEDYFEDVTLSNPENIKLFEDKVRFKIGVHLRHIANQENADVPIILCGGGSRSKYYCDIYNNNASGNRKAIQLEPIRNLLLSNPIQPNDYDRLLVAYGLATIRIGGSVKRRELDEEKEIIVTNFPGWVPSTDWEDRYISKDQV